MVADSAPNSLQHVYFNIRRLRSLNECVYIEVNAAGAWVNEIVFNEVNFREGSIGIKAYVSNGESNRVILNDCSFEAATKGVVLEQTGTGSITSWELKSPRLEECPDFFTTIGKVDNLLLVGTTQQTLSAIAGFFTFSNQTRMKMIFGNYEITVLEGLMFRYDAVASYNGAYVIPNGTDINTLRIPGKYAVTSYGAAASMVNWPNAGEFGNLYVECAAGTIIDFNAQYQYLRQTVITGSANHEYRRQIKCENGVWSVGNWITIY